MVTIRMWRNILRTLWLLVCTMPLNAATAEDLNDWPARGFFTHTQAHITGLKDQILPTLKPLSYLRKDMVKRSHDFISRYYPDNNPQVTLRPLYADVERVTKSFDENFCQGYINQESWKDIYLVIMLQKICDAVSFQNDPDKHTMLVGAQAQIESFCENVSTCFGLAQYIKRSIKPHCASMHEHDPTSQEITSFMTLFQAPQTFIKYRVVQECCVAPVDLIAGACANVVFLNVPAPYIGMHRVQTHQKKKSLMFPRYLPLKGTTLLGASGFFANHVERIMGFFKSCVLFNNRPTQTLAQTHTSHFMHNLIGCLDNIIDETKKCKALVVVHTALYESKGFACLKNSNGGEIFSINQDFDTGETLNEYNLYRFVNPLCDDAEKKKLHSSYEYVYASNNVCATRVEEPKTWDPHSQGDNAWDSRLLCSSKSSILRDILRTWHEDFCKQNGTLGEIAGRHA